MASAQDLRLFQSQTSVVEALSEGIQLPPIRIKSIIMRYCESKLANRAPEQLAVKLSLLEHELKKTAARKGVRLMPGLEAVFIEIRHELKLAPSVVFRSAPSTTASSSRPPPAIQTVTRVPTSSNGLAPPPAWTPRAEDPPPPPPPRTSSEDDLARAMRESLLVAQPPPSSIHEPATAPLPPSHLPQQHELPSAPSTSTPLARPTFNLTYLSLPLPTPSSSSSPPIFHENDPLELLATSSHQTVFLVDDSRSLRLDSSTAVDAISKLAPLVSLLSSPPELLLVKLKDLEARCESRGEVKELFEAAKVEWEEERGTRVGLGKRLGDLLQDYLRRLEKEHEREDAKECDQEVLEEAVDLEEAGFGARLRSREDASRKAIKPLSLVVFTDGTLSDDLESVLLSASRRLDRFNAPQGQLGVFFLQLGTDPLARAYLRSLSKLKVQHPSLGREIADSTIWPLPSPASISSGANGAGASEERRVEEAVLLRKILLGSINRRVAEVDLNSSSGGNES